MSESPPDSEFIRKDSPSEWHSSYSPDFHHDIDVDKAEKDASLKKKKEDELANDSDLVMEFVTEQEKRNKIRNLTIKEYVKIGDHVVYKINVHIEERSWQVSRRYREFHTLHEQLVQRHGIPWELLPPKKIVGNLSSSHLEKRKLLLEKYLKTILHNLVEMPRSVVSFLEMDQFDVDSVCRQLARDMYEIGDDLLAKGLVFKLSPLQIHCINRRLQLPLPTCESEDPREDIGHLYSFIQQVPMVLIYPGMHNKFLDQGDLTYNVSIFRSMKYLEIQRCDIEMIEGLESIQKNVKEIRIHKSTKLLKDMLIGSQSWVQGILMTVNSGREKTNEIKSKFQTWDNCLKASFSHNDIHSIDYSITLLPNVTNLDLSHNLLTEVDYLQELIYLSDLNLSYNELRHLSEFPYKIPSVSYLNLSGNGIQNIQGLEKMYCLEKLNLSNNKIKRIKDILPLGNLPLLKKLRVVGNPFTESGNYRTRILGQFGYRAKEVSLDGLLPTNREMAKIKEIIASQESYDVVTESQQPYVAKATTPPRSMSPNDAKSPTHKNRSQKRKDRLVEIKNVTKSSPGESSLSAIENEDEDFRQKIEKLREHAGDSWLTFYNEIADENEPQGASSTQQAKGETPKKKLQQQNTFKVSAEKKDRGSIKKAKDEIHAEKKTREEKPVEEQVDKKPAFAGMLSIEEIDLELSDDMRAEIKRIIREGVDVFNETYLACLKDANDTLVEYMVAIDNEAKQLVQIDFDTGSTVHNYNLESIRGFVVEEECETQATLQFEAKISDNGNNVDTSHSLVKLYTKTVKDGAGLYVVLKSFNKAKPGRGKAFSTTQVTVGLIENPFNMQNEILMAFFQDFIQKSSNKRKTTSSSKNQQHTNYENIDIGLSFLRHVDGKNTPQDVLSVLWVGCLPYLFPDEEIPVCLVMTTLNVFLFRIFYPESGQPRNFHQLTEIQEVMHCFYSFPLSSLKEVVVGLFDQGLRIEVCDEGPRGSFVFLTRDAVKTSQFLDTLASVVNIQSENSSPEQSSDALNQSPYPTTKVVYPDENKINALKVQLQEQKITPFDNRENLISYCIVYQHRNNEILGSRFHDNDDNLDGGEPTTPYLRSLILTNLRVILCDEDYVHWPLTSFVHSAPFTPQWIVDDIYSVESVIGVDLWEDTSGWKSMTGCYGVSITFDNIEREFENEELSVLEAVRGWNILFQSVSEREQFVRSLASIWKNSFEVDLKITNSILHSKRDVLASSGSIASKKTGHTKKPSGNVKMPFNQCVEQPEQFVSIDRARLNELFRNNIAQGDDHTVTGVQYVACVGCKPYNYPDLEFSVALLMGKYNIYLICSAQNRKYLLANTPFEDQGSSVTLYVNVIAISDLQQVVVGLFDQCLRLETALPEHTYVFVTRDFDRTNDFIQRLSQAILAFPVQGVKVHEGDTRGNARRATAEIFQLYKQEHEDADSSNYYPRSEFIHPNSNIKFIYPSDDLLEKLRVKILDYLRIMDFFEELDETFSVLLYALIFQLDDNCLDVPHTIVVSEKFFCIISEDHVNYPLPLFVNELPERTQYEVTGVRLISSLLRIEFDDFYSGNFTLVFNQNAVDPSYYDARFRTLSVEESDACLVTDVNTQPGDTDDASTKENVVTWQLRTHSYQEREKIFNILSKMWENIFVGSGLPVLNKKR